MKSTTLKNLVTFCQIRSKQKLNVSTSIEIFSILSDMVNLPKNISQSFSVILCIWTYWLTMRLFHLVVVSRNLQLILLSKFWLFLN